MTTKIFTVELSTDSPNNIDAKEVHMALVKYFVAFVGIDVKEAAQQSAQSETCLVCEGKGYYYLLSGHPLDCQYCKSGKYAPR